MLLCLSRVVKLQIYERMTMSDGGALMMNLLESINNHIRVTMQMWQFRMKAAGANVT